MSQRVLTALPVYNEARHVERVLAEVRNYSEEILVVDDGSNDGTSELLSRQLGIHLIAHRENRGYGAALNSAFQYAIQEGYDTLVTIDCDGQHEPQRIPRFASACRDVDLVSGSRYLKQFVGDSEPPAQRRWINKRITAELNRGLGLCLTDAFCGFKAYRVESLRQLDLQETGYAMPLELWVQAAFWGWRVIELPVPLVYLDEARSFGGRLDDGATRLEHYHQVLAQSIRAVSGDSSFRARARCGEGAG